MNMLPWATYLEHVSFDILDVIDILDIAFTLNNQGKWIICTISYQNGVGLIHHYSIIPLLSIISQLHSKRMKSSFSNTLKNDGLDRNEFGPLPEIVKKIS